MDFENLNATDLANIIAATHLLKTYTTYKKFIDFVANKSFDGMSPVIQEVFDPSKPTVTIPQSILDHSGGRGRSGWPTYINGNPFGGSKNMLSPLVLDLDGDGIETTSVSEGVNFDLNANSFAELTGWVKSDDGLLVLDRNGNGQIDNGQELFGDNTALADGKTATNGFDALAELDSNADGKIDVNDSVYAQLKIWQDTNEDGIADAGELHSLAELGVKSLAVSYQSTDYTDPQGNTVKQRSAFERIDGTMQELSDYYFQTDQMLSISKGKIPVPDDVAQMPNLWATGNVYSLHQAMARDTSGALKSLILSFAGESDPAARAALVDQILIKWTGTENAPYRGWNIDEAKLAILESFCGEKFLQQGYSAKPGPNASRALNIMYHDLAEWVYSSLAVQTFLKGIYDLVEITYDDVANSIETSLSPAIVELQSRLSADPAGGQVLIGEFFRSLRGLDIDGTFEDFLTVRNYFADQSEELGWIIDTAGKSVIAQGDVEQLGLQVVKSGTSGADLLDGTNKDDVLYGRGDNDQLFGGAGDDILDGGLGNDDLSGEMGDDFLSGREGDDVLDGGAGNDVLYGGAGNDILQGGAGNDTYMYGINSGNDTIDNSASTAGNSGNDTILFGAGLNASGLDFLQQGDNLTIKINETGETLTIQNWFKGIEYQGAFLQFADGTTLDADQVADLARTLGTSAGDYILGSETNNDKINGLGGSDVIYGKAGNDIIDGGAENDVINGGAGEDTLLGGNL